MKNIIGKKILMLIVIPFLVIFGILSVVIVRMIYTDKIGQAEATIKESAKQNSAALLQVVDSARYYIKTAVEKIEQIDPESPDGREKGEQFLIDLFENKHVYNAWMIFEPNAFDGQDAKHTGDYKGLLNGRFARSYLNKDGTIVLASDINDEVLDQSEGMNWYREPLESGKWYIDLHLDDYLLYDYQTGEGNQSTFTIASPIKRGDTVIGCIGVDILFDDIVTAIDQETNTMAVLFTASGEVIFTLDHSHLTKSIDTLNFNNITQIKDTFAQRKELYLPKEYCSFMEKNAYTYFTPVQLKGFQKELFLYTALPEEVILNDVNKILQPIIIALIAAFLTSLSIFLYISHYISRPIHELTKAADSISQGNLKADIAVLTKSKDEIGILSRSLHRMVEQFQVSLYMQDQSRDLLHIYTQITRILFQGETIKDAFDAIAMLISEHFDVEKVSYIRIENEKASLLSVYEKEKGKKNEVEDFMHHTQVLTLIQGKECVMMNTFCMEQKAFHFLDKDTKAFCLLPFVVDKRLEGYLIMEKKKERSAFIHDDTELRFIAETIVGIMIQKEEYLKALPQNTLDQAQEEEEIEEVLVEQAISDPVIEQLKALEQLDIQTGLTIVGGSEEDYKNVVRIFAVHLEETIKKLDTLLIEESADFAIEVHGIKGALNNIGAGKLGNIAYQLEKAAKSQDMAYCKEHFLDFQGQLLVFQEQLSPIFVKTETVKEVGNENIIRDHLKDLREACDFYNSSDAEKYLNIMTEYSYGETIDTVLNHIRESLELFEFEQAVELVDELISKVGE